MIAQESHRIDRFPGRSAGYEQMPSGQGLAGEQFRAGSEQIGGFDHAPRSHVAAGLIAFGRPEHAIAAAADFVQVLLGARIGPHALVHRRRDGDRRGSRQDQGGKQVIGPAMGGAGEKIGARRRDEYEIGPAREFDMSHRRLGFEIQQIHQHAVSRQRLHRQRRNEFLRRARHDHAHLGPGPREQAGQFGALVRGDSTGNAQQNALVGQGRHIRARLPRGLEREDG